MRELALHILDLAENSVSAQAKTINIGAVENYLTDRLSIWVEDDGKGMDAETVARVIDPFVTSRTTRKVGLGIPLLKAAAEMCNGDLLIHSKPGEGTRIDVDFQHSHLDRMPLGDLQDTYLTLLVAHPEVHWLFTYQLIGDQNENVEFFFDDGPVKETLDGISLCEPAVLEYLRQVFREGFSTEEQIIH